MLNLVQKTETNRKQRQSENRDNQKTEANSKQRQTENRGKQKTETIRKQWNECRFLTMVWLLYCKLRLISCTGSTSKLYKYRLYKAKRVSTTNISVPSKELLAK